MESQDRRHAQRKEQNKMEMNRRVEKEARRMELREEDVEDYKDQDVSQLIEQMLSSSMD